MLEVQGLVLEIENLVKGEEQEEAEAEDETRTGAVFDCVCIQHPFTDHCHRSTLEELDCSVPVFAASVSLVSSASFKIDSPMTIFHLSGRSNVNTKLEVL